MRILVISDSHGDYKSLEKALSVAEPYDTVIFLGDGNDEFSDLTRNLVMKAVCAVKGNSDYGSSLPVASSAEFNGHRILFCHGHTFAVKQDKSIVAAAARQNKCEAAIFGHTHRRFVENCGGIWLFNPGSVSSPRDGKPPSYGIITLDKEEISFKHFDLIK